jgi:hypothetical protein
MGGASRSRKTLEAAGISAGGPSPKQERRGVREMRLNAKPEKRRRTAA